MGYRVAESHHDDRFRPGLRNVLLCVAVRALQANFLDSELHSARTISLRYGINAAERAKLWSRKCVWTQQ